MVQPVSAAFKNALIAPVRDVTMRVTALDASFSQIADITGPSVEGVVYVDTQRATRRTAQIRVVNKDGLYTPKGSDFESLGTNSIFWWNKQFKLEYGVAIADGIYEYVTVGTFMVDRFEILSERGISIINIDGSDQWKRFSFSEFSQPTAWASGTSYNTIITDMATTVGVTRFNLDPLSERASTEKTIQTPLAYEEGVNIGTTLFDLAKAWGLEVYFNVDGYLTTRSVLDANTSTASPAWEFSYGSGAIFLSVAKSKSGDTIKNHIVVVGEADDGTAIVRAEAINGSGTNVLSGVGVTWKYYTNTFNPTTVQQIGDRVKTIRSKTLRTSQACLDLAKIELTKNVVVEEEVRLPTIVVPHLEGNDVIRIVEPLSDTNEKYILQAFDIPMRGSQQEIFVKKVVAI